MGQTIDNHFNEIDDTAEIAPDVSLGWYNYFGPGVKIGKFSDGRSKRTIAIGDCNKFYENTRILCDGAVSIGDWCTFHNHTDVLGTGHFIVGHNLWVGQYGYMDVRGGLTIGNGVRIGCNVHIWSHVAAGELIEGCTLIGEHETNIDDDVWLVGDNIHVSPGVHLRYRSIILPHSVVTHDTNRYETYVGAPAKSMGIKHWREVTNREKFDMMVKWLYEFMRDVLLPTTGPRNQWTLDYINENIEDTQDNDLLATLYNVFGQRIVVGIGEPRNIEGELDTYFDLASKRYTKKLTWLERAFYTYIQNHKARFLPYPGVKTGLPE